MLGLQKTKKCRGRQRKGSGVGLIVAAALMCGPATASSLDEEIANLKAEVSAHADEVFQLEQQVLHPVDTRLAIFLTLASRDGLNLHSVELFVNGQPVASHLYTGRERGSLKHGGIQQLFTGNLANGAHQLKAVITARAANDRFVRRESTHRFQKRPGALRLQVALEAKAPDYEPRVSFVEWK
ncbi:MAG: AraC family transcriptional regulator [Marinobacter sp.]